MYGILWTVGCILTPRTGKELWEPWENDIWRKALGAVIAVMTMYDIVMLIQSKFFFFNMSNYSMTGGLGNPI